MNFLKQIINRFRLKQLPYIPMIGTISPLKDGMYKGKDGKIYEIFEGVWVDA